jgi:hypothetical protein
MPSRSPAFLKDRMVAIWVNTRIPVSLSIATLLFRGSDMFGYLVLSSGIWKEYNSRKWGWLSALLEDKGGFKGSYQKNRLKCAKIAFKPFSKLTDWPHGIRK